MASWNRAWSSVTETWATAVGNWGDLGYSPATQTLTFTTEAPNIPVGIGVSAGTLTITGYPPITVEDMPHVIPAGATLTLTGSVPGIAQGVEDFPAKGTLTLTGSAPVPGITYRFTIENGNLVIEGQDVDPQHRAPKYKPEIQVI